MQTAWIAYEGKRLAAKSDGVELVRFYDFNKREWLDEPVWCEWKEEYVDLTVGQGNNVRPMFKLHSTLNVVIASKAARWGGYYKLRTTSQISAAQLYGSMLFTKENLTFGLLRGVPLQLVVRPIQVNPEGKATTVFVVHLEARGDDMEAIRDKALRCAEYELKNSLQVGKAHRQYLALMRSPADFDEVEAEEIAQEFHPIPALEAGPAEPPAGSSRTSALSDRLAGATKPAEAPTSPPLPPPVDDGINEPPEDHHRIRPNHSIPRHGHCRTGQRLRRQGILGAAGPLALLSALVPAGPQVDSRGPGLCPKERTSGPTNSLLASGEPHQVAKEGSFQLTASRSDLTKHGELP